MTSPCWSAPRVTTGSRTRASSRTSRSSTDAMPFRGSSPPARRTSSETWSSGGEPRCPSGAGTPVATGRTGLYQRRRSSRAFARRSSPPGQPNCSRCGTRRRSPPGAARPPESSDERPTGGGCGASCSYSVSTRGDRPRVCLPGRGFRGRQGTCWARARSRRRVGRRRLPTDAGMRDGRDLSHIEGFVRATPSIGPSLATLQGT